MNKKDFQIAALEALEFWIGKLNQHKRTNDWKAVPHLAWVDAFEKSPNKSTEIHKERKDAGGKTFPHACIKIPTGGGKTFTAANALTLMMRTWKRQQTGLVIWLVPTNAIYEQTLKALSGKSEWIHQHLNQACGGRLKVFTRESNFTKNDVDNFLCIMLLTNQSFIEKDKENKTDKRLKINRMASGYDEGFFPDGGNVLANRKFLEQHKGLDILGRTNTPIPSLINAIRVCRPVVIIDEAHKTNTELSIKGTSSLNPSIVLEISATPLEKSNILYTATGREVWEEEMIKLPIELYNRELSSWKATMSDAVDKRNSLEKIASEEVANGGEYIRPIMVIRVDFTGKKQEGKSVHAYEARKHLNTFLGIPLNQIAIQSSEQKDLKGVNLMSDTCQIRYIITKDALKEGWDCPFASVLAILGTLKARVGITQMLGRVMRQPYAKRAENEELNSPYIFCSTNDTNDALAWAKASLDSEGYADVSNLFTKVGGGAENPRKKTPRRKSLRGCKIYFPKIKILDGGIPRGFNYDSDLMPLINWNELKYSNPFPFSSRRSKKHHRVIDVDGKVIDKPEEALPTKNEFDIIFLTERLLDIIPNICVAARIIDDALQHYADKHTIDAAYAQQINIVENIKNEISIQINRKARDIFDKMIENKQVQINFVKGDEDIADWPLPEFDFYNEDARDIRDQKKYAFEKLNNSAVNTLEADAATSFEGTDIVEWWFRNTSRRSNKEYFLQGWERKKVYPDFLLATAVNKDGHKKLMVIETKGDHIANSDDTKYKRDLLSVIEARINEQQDIKTHYFRVIDERNWEREFNELIIEK